MWDEESDILEALDEHSFECESSDDFSDSELDSDIADDDDESELDEDDIYTDEEG
jgi:hypothetical protein